MPVDSAPLPIRLADYRPPAYLVPEVALDFDVRSASDVVLTARSQFRRNPVAGRDEPVTLNGKELSLASIKIDGLALKEGVDYSITGTTLTIPHAPDRFTLEVVTQLDPSANKSAAGLFFDGDGMLLTQCESNDFSRMTWFADRPDVMAKYKTTISADPETFPVLLSNGNIGSDRLSADGRRTVQYIDPFPKPSYLFALVATDFDCLQGQFQTMSGRTIGLEFYTPKGKADQAEIGLSALKKAMKWDEERFGLECDVDRFAIVSTDTFNAGAMENKGLNVFNAEYVLLRPDLATDDTIKYTEATIAHEYFHNWTGNRVTCRDWFQLTLKEGLTVYRDQEFSSDMDSRTIKRIEDVRSLRSGQFKEDAGPTAHAIRPESCVEIHNLYTNTIYYKGAEIVRMLATLVGKQGFRDGMDLYFQRHDGKAVTCEDFLSAIVDANAARVSFDVDLFKRWYSQAGTPVVTASSAYDEASGTWTLTCTQTAPPTPGQPDKQPMLIPISLGLLDSTGNDMKIGPNGETEIALQLTGAAQEFKIEGLKEKPVPSLLRNFSAPVRLKYNYSDSDLAFLMAHDSDGFNRWDAGQRLATKAVLAGLDSVAAGGSATQTPEWQATKAAMGSVLADTKLDPEAKAQMLRFPDIRTMGQEVAELDYQALSEVRVALFKDFATDQKRALLQTYRGLDKDVNLLDISSEAMADRALKNVALGYLSNFKEPEIDAMLYAQAIRSPAAMTDVVGALGSLAHRSTPLRDKAFGQFIDKWQGETGPVITWFNLQAGAHRPDVLEQIEGLMHHPLFDNKNPNQIRSLLWAFAANVVYFHATDGSGYRFMADQIIAADAFNPVLGAQLANTLLPPPNLVPAQKVLIAAELERITASGPLWSNTSEIVHKALAAARPAEQDFGQRSVLIDQAMPSL